MRRRTISKMEIVQVGVAIIESTTFKIPVYFSSYYFLHNHYRIYDDL